MGSAVVLMLFGTLNAEEKKASHDSRKAEHEARQQESIKKYDKDGDGKLTGAEVTPIEEKQTVKFNRDENERLSSAEIT